MLRHLLVFMVVIGAVLVAPPLAAEAANRQPDTNGVSRTLVYFAGSATASRIVNVLESGSLSDDAVSAAGVRLITCFVNFTADRHNTSSHSDFTWAGGVGCTAAIILSGRAFLLESATHYVQYGQYIAPTVRRSYSSGGHIVERGHPSVYIHHEIDMKLLPSQQVDTIVGVVAQPGTRLDGASHCHQTDFTPNGPVGAHCDLFSKRF